MKEGGVFGTKGLSLQGLRKSAGSNEGLDNAGLASARENLRKIRGMTLGVVVNTAVHLIG